ncbi:hypothetical protein AVEN_155699-1 [Araneus ventricosus]|uniref:Uncharacterized protein n=1 Tax=Araneus ventricosus TaxID=182803 RepID=A0A4Y2U338_ARAVE|nr:hypothetical protein AVEN_155699-1 [Araneus ventricosus]
MGLLKELWMEVYAFALSKESYPYSVMKRPWYSDILIRDRTSPYPKFHRSVELHQDRARSHVSQSTVKFLEKIEEGMAIKTVAFTDIPAKSPDVSYW